MTPLSGAWHVLGFAVPAVAVACLSAVIAKWLWRPEFRATTLARLSGTASACSALGFTCSVAWLGHDGQMAAYAVMVVCCALSIWWFARGSASG